MKTKTDEGERVVVAGAVRTPIGQAGKTLIRMPSWELGLLAVEELFSRTKIPKNEIDGICAGEIAQSSQAPNVARVIAVKSSLPLKSSAVTVANNCASGYEAIMAAARRILIGEGSLYVVAGVESMSRFHFYLSGAKENPKTATVDKLKSNWCNLLSMGVDAVDSLEEGLTDPIRKLNMAMTGEVAVQNYKLTKRELDDYAWLSYKKTWDATISGKYRPYTFKVFSPDGMLEDDEYILSKKGMVENKDRFYRASPIFDSKYMSLKEFYHRYGEWIRYSYSEGESVAGVTLFNACPRSDGAGALFVTTEKKARELGLEVQAVIRSWGVAGVDPAYMGVGMAHAMKKALDVAGKTFDDVRGYEIHEAFSATALATMREVQDSYRFNLESKNEEGLVNPNGGTLAIGHPLGATGIRMVINQIIHIKEKKIQNCLGAICAGGGVAGSILLEPPES